MTDEVKVSDLKLLIGGEPIGTFKVIKEIPEGDRESVEAAVLEEWFRESRAESFDVSSTRTMAPEFVEQWNALIETAREAGGEFKEFEIDKGPDCPECGAHNRWNYLRAETVTPFRMDMLIRCKECGEESRLVNCTLLSHKVEDEVNE